MWPERCLRDLAGAILRHDAVLIQAYYSFTRKESGMGDVEAAGLTVSLLEKQTRCRKPARVYGNTTKRTIKMRIRK
jgi:hypothetical protein